MSQVRGRLRHRRWSGTVGIAAVALVVAAACGSDGDRTLAGVIREPALDVSAVELPDARDGSARPMRADDGGLLVVYFGYTACPDVCPTTMSDLSVAINDLTPAAAERVEVAFVTVDPDRDTADVLEGYLDHFFTDGLPLRTEDPAALEAAATSFGVEFEVADHGPDETAYEVAHTAVTYVVDATGRVAVEWPFGFESDAMTDDLTTLLTEEAP